jgi:hypothetical protein
VNGHIRFASWTGEGLTAGEHEGTAVHQGALVLQFSRGAREYDDPHRADPPAKYEEACWTSPEVSPGFSFSELVSSWNARTPPGTWIEVSLRVSTTTGVTTPWYVMGRWAETDQDISPTSVPGQRGEHVRVDVDRLGLVEERTGASYRLRVSLLRREGSCATPSVTLLGTVASDVTAGEHEATPSRNGAAGIVLDVPTYSQQLHLGEYPQWAGGGESWCSPTSTSMVLGHWGLGPSSEEYTWVPPEGPDRCVPYAARHTFDHAYGAPGNWSFNAAYAARFGTTAFVTRLRSLAEAELFVRAGIPLVVGIAFTEDQLDGAGYATTGHLAVVVGFDERGDVVCNDPASHEVASNDAVRAVFDRDQFERAWMRSSGGVTYVIRPPGVPLPQAPVEANW